MRDFGDTLLNLIPMRVKVVVETGPRHEGLPGRRAVVSPMFGSRLTVDNRQLTVDG